MSLDRCLAGGQLGGESGVAQAAGQKPQHLKLCAGFAGRSDRRAGAAAAVVAGETLVFAANGFRCPLTELTERYGAEHGTVTDIYLPKWFAHNLPAIHAPLLVLMVYLHTGNRIHLHSATAAAPGH